ncbi:Lrp/AsnC family transcriptional regulator [Candidatus Woesearchaeota archaeon]|nr:Lrp/AsnC family transcriptional regulator [Candidatus Woesearchaeota archaeon]
MEQKSLSKKDLDIIKVLDTNARLSYSNIAKKVNTSKEVINYRMRILSEKKIIKKYYTLVNWFSLGFMSYRIFFKYHYSDPTRKYELLKYLQNHANWIIETSGRWDLVVLIYVKSLSEVKDFLLKFTYEFGDCLNYSYKFAPIIKYTLLSNTEIYDSIEKESLVIEDSSNKCVDDLDVRILRYIATDARLKVTLIAKQLNVPVSLVIRRIKRLEDDNIIVGYTTKLNFIALGFSEYTVMLHLKKIRNSDLDRLNYYVSIQKEVICITDSFGLSDFEFIVRVKQCKDFLVLMSKIYSNFSKIIVNHDILLTTKLVKTNYCPF